MPCISYGIIVSVGIRCTQSKTSHCMSFNSVMQFFVRKFDWTRKNLFSKTKVQYIFNYRFAEVDFELLVE